MATKINVFALVFLILLPIKILLAQGTKENGEKNFELRPGMEYKKIGSITTIVPEGSEVYKKHGVYILEAPEEYAARRFKEMEARFEQDEKRIKDLDAKLEKLSREIEQLKTNLSNANAEFISEKQNEIPFRGEVISKEQKTQPYVEKPTYEKKENIGILY